MDINDESEQEGPGLVEASIKERERVDKAFAEFTIEADWPRLEPHLRTLMSSQETRLVVVLDAPTSRAKIVTAMIDKVGELIQSNSQKEVHLLVPAGARFLDRQASRSRTNISNPMMCCSVISEAPPCRRPPHADRESQVVCLLINWFTMSFIDYHWFSAILIDFHVFVGSQ